MHRSHAPGSSSFGMFTIWRSLYIVYVLKLDAKTGVGFCNEVEVVTSPCTVQQRRADLASNRTDR